MYSSVAGTVSEDGDSLVVAEVLAVDVLELIVDADAAFGAVKKEVMDAFALGFLASEVARSTALRLRDMMMFSQVWKFNYGSLKVIFC